MSVEASQRRWDAQFDSSVNAETRKQSRKNRLEDFFNLVKSPGLHMGLISAFYMCLLSIYLQDQAEMGSKCNETMPPLPKIIILKREMWWIILPVRKEMFVC